MRLDEAITVSSVERFIDKKKASIALGTVASISAAALSGGSIPVIASSVAAAGILGALLDKYLNGKKLAHEIEKINLYTQKRATIIAKANASGYLKSKFLDAAMPALRKLKHDTSAIAHTVITELVSKKKSMKDPDDIKAATNVIKAMREIIHDNARPLRESHLNEALALIPVTFVAIMYMRDKIALGRSFSTLTSIYHKNKHRPVSDYFDKVEPYIWKYLTEISNHYYRGFVSKEVFEQQADVVINIMNTKDLSIIFNGNK